MKQKSLATASSEPWFAQGVGLLGLVLNLADVCALSGVHDVPWCEVEEEGIGIESHVDGEEQEGGAAPKLHEVHLLPVES